MFGFGESEKDMHRFDLDECQKDMHRISLRESSKDRHPLVWFGLVSGRVKKI